MGAYIKSLRKGLDLSQEELGKRLNPPVNAAAVNKWESGAVENIRRTHIHQMSKLFGVNPCELMCFDDFSEKDKAFFALEKCAGREAVKMVDLFMKLNRQGKEKALSDLEDMLMIPKYTEKREESKNTSIFNLIF